LSNTTCMFICGTHPNSYQNMHYTHDENFQQIIRGTKSGASRLHNKKLDWKKIDLHLIKSFYCYSKVMISLFKHSKVNLRMPRRTSDWSLWKSSFLVLNVWIICLKNTKNTCWRSNYYARLPFFTQNFKDEYLHLCLIWKDSLSS